jgi:hypothetical protein
MTAARLTSFYEYQPLPGDSIAIMLEDFAPFPGSDQDMNKIKYSRKTVEEKVASIRKSVQSFLTNVIKLSDSGAYLFFSADGDCYDVLLIAWLQGEDLPYLVFYDCKSADELVVPKKEINPDRLKNFSQAGPCTRASQTSFHPNNNSRLRPRIQSS